MIAEGVAKNVIYRCIDCALPGAGLAIQTIEMVYKSCELAEGYKRMSKNERKRKAIGLFMDANGD
jgi:hypothetical protein